jgi:predicted transcriptional regulator
MKPLYGKKAMPQKRYTLPDELARWVARVAKKQNRSESSIVREALYAYRQAAAVLPAKDAA